MVIAQKLQTTVLLALALIPVASGLKDDLPASEYEALLAFYEATNGDSWENNTGWLDADAWFGITTSLA